MAEGGRGVAEGVAAVTRGRKDGACTSRLFCNRVGVAEVGVAVDLGWSGCEKRCLLGRETGAEVGGL